MYKDGKSKQCIGNTGWISIDQARATWKSNEKHSQTREDKQKINRNFASDSLKQSGSDSGENIRLSVE